MDRKIESNVESKQEWTSPELKKIDIDQITAHGGSTGTDGSGIKSFS